MNILDTVEMYITEVNLSTDRTEQLNKIKKYATTDAEKSDVCHYFTGAEIRQRQVSDDYIVLCGTDKDTIFHSFLVDKNGKNLVGKESKYINPDINLDDTSCIIKSKMMPKGMTYPYMETLKVSDIIDL